MQQVLAARLPQRDTLLELWTTHRAQLAALALAMLGFFFIKYHLVAAGDYASATTDPNPQTFPLRAGLLCLLTLLGLKVRSADLDVPVRRFLRVLGVVIGFYAFTSAPTLLAGDRPHAELVTGLVWLGWAAPALVVLAWWRPVALLPLVALMFWQKSWMALFNAGNSVSSTDYLPLFDTVLLLLSALLVLAYLPRLALWRRLEAERVEARAISPQMLVFFALIGIHLSNYFHSGVAKIVLDGGPLRWLLENRTDYLAHTAWELGILPLAAWPALAGAVLALLQPPMVQVINALTLFPQLFSPLAVLSRRTMIGFLLFFDLQHLGIAVLTGVFFWKWIALNTAFVVALARWPEKRLPPVVGLLVAALSMVVLVVPGIVLPGGYRISNWGQPLFFTARLGWYDTPAVNHAYATAILDDGRELRVPTNYFLAFSLSAAQQDYANVLPHMWPTGTFGTTVSYEQMKLGLACRQQLTDVVHPVLDPSHLVRFTRERHAEALALAGADGQLAYDLYPHHIWSNPLLYRDFAGLDLRRIKAFRWSIEAVCVDWSGGARHTRVINQQQVEVPLP